MLKLFIDQDFNHDILRGLRARIPNLDYVTALELGRSREQDISHLEWAIEESRVIVSHDVNTFTKAVNNFLDKGNETPGLVIVPPINAYWTGNRRPRNCGLLYGLQRVDITN